MLVYSPEGVEEIASQDLTTRFIKKQSSVEQLKSVLAGMMAVSI
jgi:hypothetical protein